MNAKKKSQEKAITKAELEALRQKVITLATQNPGKVATILTLWIHSNPKSNKNKK